MFSFTKFFKNDLFPKVRADDDDDEDVLNPRDAIVVSSIFPNPVHCCLSIAVIGQLKRCGYVQLFILLDIHSNVVI